MMAAKIETRLYINGQFVNARSGKQLAVYNPATEEKIVEVSEADKEDVDIAVQAANRAFPEWRTKSAFEREALFIKLADLVERDRKEIAYLDAISMGVPTSIYDNYITFTAAFIKYNAGLVHGVHGETSLNTPGFVSMTVRQPFGVCAAIFPWNVPVLMFMAKLVPCVVAGNCIVMKSSEKAPLSSIKLAALCHEAGFPPGVVNVITGYGPSAGAALSEHMDVRKLSFTGSTIAGKIITAAAAKSNMKKVTIETGGKNPCIIFSDADLQKAVADCTASVHLNSGQICVSNSRIYVEEGIFDAFMKAFTSDFASVAMGDPLDPTTYFGPQVDKDQFHKVLRYIENAKAAGATVVVGGQRATPKGYFIQPTVIIGAKEDSEIMREEVFGPVVVVQRFSTEEEVVRLCNNTDYGLHASIFTCDVSRAYRVAQALESGLVNINCGSTVCAYDLPFGGYKSSGIGRELGHVGLEAYYEVKTVTLKL
ncbi:aldehyde dehydrogenase domain-containing protein [Xylogone sp. PMI_703]|nr:aldehyde dehydrogenase domain-containing protein [Xylogone sp. PMI_703]